MRIVSKPDLEFSSVLDTCIAGVGNSNIRMRLSMLKNSLIDNSIEYENRAKAEELYLLDSYSAEGVTVPLVLKKELTNLYDHQVARKGRPGRCYYDKLRSSAPHGLCPFCGISTARTLDHIMPKSHYPNFSIFPFNLVPCCRDCNTEKLDQIATSDKEQKMHPYFDNFTSEQWLFACVINCDGPIITFYTITKPEWGIKKNSKITGHLSTYDLYDRFGDLASCELVGIKSQLQHLYENGGAEAVKSDLVARASSHRNNYINSWQTAMYQALSQTFWYYNGGFSLAS